MGSSRGTSGRLPRVRERRRREQAGGGKLLPPCNFFLTCGNVLVALLRGLELDFGGVAKKDLFLTFPPFLPFSAWISKSNFQSGTHDTVMASMATSRDAAGCGCGRKNKALAAPSPKFRKIGSGGRTFRLGRARARTRVLRTRLPKATTVFVYFYHSPDAACRSSPSPPLACIELVDTSVSALLLSPPSLSSRLCD